VCPHQRIPVLYDGHINNGVVTCPMHGWEFDLCNRDGRRPGLRHYETLEHEGWVYAILQ
jgi:nitrite reductase/ring-hydroxylating ferredoxin subunit